MDVLRQQMARIQQQLGELSASQKMLVASLVAVMVMTLLFWSRYAGTADMEPVLDQSLKSDEIARITGQIRNKGIEYKVVGDRILVSADRKLEVLADLSYNQLVPQDTRGAYDEIIKRINPWSSQSDNDATRNDAKASFLAQVIRQFPNVRSADVIIDPTDRRTIGGGGREPTAAVLIITKEATNKRADRVLVDAVAGTVHGAQSGLEFKNINVIVNGVRYTVSDHEEMGVAGGDDVLSMQQEAEQSYAQKVQQQLSFAGQVLVSITCDMNMTSEDRKDEFYDPKKSVQQETEVTNETNEDSAAVQPKEEPGAISNAPLSVPSAGGGSEGGGTSTKEKSSTKFENHPGMTQLQTRTPPGKNKVIGAAVRVPLSYFIVEYKRKNPSASAREPDDAALQPIILAEATKIRNEVKKCTGLANDEDVSVEPYSDTMPLLAGTTTVATAGASSALGISAILGGHYKEIVLGALALVSLFMVSSVIKKGSTSPAVPTAMELSEAPALSSGEDIAGDVGEGTSTLDGMELDPDTVRAQQMVEQVSTMVKENPDAAANLVKRWLNRS